VANYHGRTGRNRIMDEIRYDHGFDPTDEDTFDSLSRRSSIWTVPER
jgi:hypothetical protein